MNASLDSLSNPVSTSLQVYCQVVCSRSIAIGACSGKPMFVLVKAKMKSHLAMMATSMHPWKRRRQLLSLLLLVVHQALHAKLLRHYSLNSYKTAEMHVTSCIWV